MTSSGEALEAILGLLLGGIIFITFGSALAGTALDVGSFLNFGFWGALYILAAFVLAVVLVVGFASSLFDSL